MASCSGVCAIAAPRPSTKSLVLRSTTGTRRVIRHDAPIRVTSEYASEVSPVRNTMEKTLSEPRIGQCTQPGRRAAVGLANSQGEAGVEQPNQERQDRS